MSRGLFESLRQGAGRPQKARGFAPFGQDPGGTPPTRRVEPFAAVNPSIGL